MSMNIKPLGGRVVLRILQKEEVTKSGIVLPDTVDKEKKSEGEVVAIGPGKMLESGQRAEIEVSVGQKVLVKSWGGDEVEIEGETYKIFDAEDILAVLA
jgi:chaperonin GroES